MFFFSSRRRHTRSLRDWSSDVCSSDLGGPGNVDNEGPELGKLFRDLQQANITVYAFDVRGLPVEIGRASCRERVSITVVAASSNKKQKNTSLAPCNTIS